MREFFHGWRRKAGVVSFVMACVGVALLPRFLDPYDDASFNRSVWKSSTQEQRAKMTRDVITKHIRRGAASNGLDRRGSTMPPSSGRTHVRWRPTRRRKYCPGNRSRHHEDG